MAIDGGANTKQVAVTIRQITVSFGVCVCVCVCVYVCVCVCVCVSVCVYHIGGVLSVGPMYSIVGILARESYRGIYNWKVVEPLCIYTCV